MMQENNVIITGIHRSGTTLTCYLLNKLPDTVALNEPIVVFEWAALPYPFPEVICNDIGRFFTETRQSLLKHGTAYSKHIRGQIPDNTVEGDAVPDLRLVRHFWRLRLRWNRLRRNQATRGVINIPKPLSHSFLLCIKHTGEFTSVLDSLSRRYPSFAIVRNPLAVLASWNSVAFNVQKGRIPAAEMLDYKLAKALAQIDDRFDRQLYILAWFFEQYYQALPNIGLLRYEDIVATNGKALAIITPRAQELNVSLTDRNDNWLYDHKLMHLLGKKLLKIDGAFWEFYSKESVRRLLETE